MSDHDFCRFYLTDVMKEVGPLTTPAERKAAWAMRISELSTSEFHGPSEFYWHGDACCLWAAKSSGWEAWVATQSQGDDEDQSEEEARWASMTQAERDREEADWYPPGRE